MQTNIKITNVVKQLDPYPEIVFGPFVGEYGWEILRWSGFIRWYKLNNPTKRIIVSTRCDRYDLYHNCVDDLDLFILEGDYKEFSPNCYHGSGLDKEQYQELVNGLKTKYPNAFIFQPFQYGCFRNLFNFKQMDFDYTPEETNKKMIDHIFEKLDNTKIPIVVASRHRVDMDKRNWGERNWNTLFHLLERTGRFSVFVAGKSPSYIKATPKIKCAANLEDYVDVNNNNTSDIGLTIEAIKLSKLVIGAQSGTILLSNLLRTPSLFWGHEINRTAVKENIFNTRCITIEDMIYVSTPATIVDKIRQEFKI